MYYPNPTKNPKPLKIRFGLCSYFVWGFLAQHPKNPIFGLGLSFGSFSGFVTLYLARPGGGGHDELRGRHAHGGPVVGGRQAGMDH